MAAQRDAPPLWFWALPAGVAALRMLPLLSTLAAPPPPGTAFLGLSYLPADFLQYAALARQVPQEGTLFFYDPYTTEPQSGRFLLLFHWLVGATAWLTNAAPLTVFEWSRVPLLFAFFAVLWGFLRELLPERRERLAACTLVAFASGLEVWAVWLATPHLPESWALRLREDTSPYYGWSVFASGFNPLWIAAVTLALLVLRPLLFRAERPRRALAGAGALFAVLFYVHPYTAAGVLAIAAAAPALELALERRLDVRRHAANALALGLALVPVGVLSLWQLQDPVYRATSGGVFGSWGKSVLWYPLTLGGVGVLALAGARRWQTERRFARSALFGWVAAAAFLHSGPFLNGYKFVFLLPLPLCILAAPAARSLFARGPWLAAGAALVLFSGALLQTAEAVRSTREVGRVPADMLRLAESLAHEPAAHALTSPGIGSVLPAFTPHRVFVGHFFLTPHFSERAAAFRRFVHREDAAPELRRTVREQGIRYVVVPSEHAEAMARRLEGEVAERRRFGILELLIVR